MLEPSATLHFYNKMRREKIKAFHDTHQKIIIMALKPKYAKMIYEGKKFWEFRKKAPPLLQQVFIYESAPVSKITGSVIFRSAITGYPSDVIEMVGHNSAFTKNTCGITVNEIMQYCKGSKTLTALRVYDPRRLDEPVDLNIAPPQNWGTFYIPSDKVVPAVEVRNVD